MSSQPEREGLGGGKLRGNGPAYSFHSPSPNLVSSLAKLGVLWSPPPGAKGTLRKREANQRSAQHHGLSLDLQPQSGHPGFIWLLRDTRGMSSRLSKVQGLSFSF